MTPAFRKLWLAQTLSALGDRAHQVALTWWTLATTGSLALTGAMLIASTLPYVLLGPVAGALADRWPRQPLMVACDLARAVLVLGVAYLAWRQALTPLLLLAATTLLTALTAVFSPAAMSTVPALVPEEARLAATARMEASVEGMGILGPAVGGLAVAAWGAQGAFTFNGVSFLLSGLLLVLVHVPPVPAAGGEPFREALWGGVRVLRRLPTVAGALAGLAACNVFSTPVLLFLPYFAKDVFQVGAPGLGWLEACLGLGTVASAVAWGRIGKVGRRFPFFVGGFAGMGLLIGMMGWWPTYPLHLVALGLIGLCLGTVNVLMLNFFQERVPEEELGRFFGIMTSVSLGLVPLSFGIYGMLAALVAPAQLLVLNGVGLVGVAIGLFLVPGLRSE
jgi:MFS family permease